MSAWVLVLLKLLLAAVSASTSPHSAVSSNFGPVSSRLFGSMHQWASLSALFTATQDQPPAPPPTLDEMDVIRHREVTSKAVSAILLLALKWFKVSRE
jgi:hypothetical protein